MNVPGYVVGSGGGSRPLQIRRKASSLRSMFEVCNLVSLFALTALVVSA